jgi:hypothetical protein
MPGPGRQLDLVEALGSSPLPQLDLVEALAAG